MKKLKFVIFVLIIFLIFYFTFSCAKAEIPAKEDLIEAETAIEEIPDNEVITEEEQTTTESSMNLEENNEENISALEDEKVFEIGDIIKFDDLEFSVNGITIREGSEGFINLLVEVSIKNNGDVERKISSWTMFDLLDEFKRSQAQSGLVGSKGHIDGAVIPPGKTLVGEIPYAVSEDIKELDLKVGLNLSTEEVEFLNNMLKQIFAGEDISAADIKRAEELENREYVMVKIFLE